MSDDRLTTTAAPGGDQHRELLALYDKAVDHVYRYLRARCGSDQVAEDLTSDTFLGAVDTLRRRPVDDVSVAWLIGIARHKLVDHWRRVERQERLAHSVGEAESARLDHTEDAWDTVLDVMTARQTLEGLGPHHRGALTLRYLDGLAVADVANHLGRSVGATEVLLVRARKAFRSSYESQITMGEGDR